MPLKFDDNIKSLLGNLFACMMIMFTIYLIFFKINKEHFNGAETALDIWYFTTTTQSSTGYGDITPKTQLMKFITSIHHIFAILITLQFVYHFAN